MGSRVALRVAAFVVLIAGKACAGWAGTAFTAVAAGDATSRSVILWTRTVDAETAQPLAVPLTVELARGPDFRDILFAFRGASDRARDGTLKIEAVGLATGTRYFYRFRGDDGALSPMGAFRTAPRDEERVAVRFAFSGDANGAYRPYPLAARFGDLDLDFFVFLGDTMYETASAGSPAAADPFTNPTQALIDYRRKYLENLLPVRPGGFPSLGPLFAAQANYTLLDNHELGNGPFQSGGAPPGDPAGKGADPTDPSNDGNGACTFINRTPGFAALLQAYLDFQPVREQTVAAPGDCRSDGTRRLYFAQRWGANVIFINVDDRSYRDIRLSKSGSDDIGPRAGNPARTMLGATQLAWLQQTLLAAQAQGVTWKIVALSSPIDEVGPFGPGSAWDGPKTWIGGYRAERDRLLQFIADNRIEHVVFLSTDDHLNRVHDLYYLRDAGDLGSRAQLPGALTIVAGPMGAAEPDRFLRHDWSSVRENVDKLAAQQRAAGIVPIGLRPQFPGLRKVFREGHPEADSERGPADFYSADTFNYVTLDVRADGKALAIATWGIDFDQPNSFPEPDQVARPRRILAFELNVD